MNVRFKLDYRKFPAQPTEPFPQRRSVSRPVVPVALIKGTQRVRNLALIDSGADYCIFHAAIGEQIGLQVESGKRLTFFGTAGQEQKVQGGSKYHNLFDTLLCSHYHIPAFRN